MCELLGFLKANEHVNVHTCLVKSSHIHAVTSGCSFHCSKSCVTLVITVEVNGVSDARKFYPTKTVLLFV